MSEPVQLPEGFRERAQDALDYLFGHEKPEQVLGIASYALVIGRMFHALMGEPSFTWAHALDVVQIKAVTPYGWPSGFELRVSAEPLAQAALGDLARNSKFHAARTTAARVFAQAAEAESPRVYQLAVWAGFLGAFWELAGTSSSRARAFPAALAALEVRFDADGFPEGFTVRGGIKLPPRGRPLRRRAPARG